MGVSTGCAALPQMAGSETLWFDPQGTGYLVCISRALMAAWSSSDFPYAISRSSQQADGAEAGADRCGHALHDRKGRNGFACALAADLAGGSIPQRRCKGRRTAEQPVSAPADSSSSNSKKTASKKKAAPKPAAKANPVEGDPLAERKAVLQRKLKAYYANDPGIFPTWVASMK